jgi:drug/metabolite transporter (DMT)-like permease
LRPYGLVLGAATAWGTIGTAYAIILDGVAINPVTLVTLRAGTAFAFLLAFALVARRGALRVRARDLPLLAIFGLITVTIFYLALIYAYQLTSVAIGTVLLYLGPAYVTILSALFLGETITRRKGVALGLCLLGAVLVVEPWRRANLGANGLGIALGLLSAITYGSYSVLGKPLLRRHAPLTLLLYGLGFGTLGLLPVHTLAGSSVPGGLTLLALVAVAGVLITLLPLGLYTLALAELPSSTASIVATFEPVVAITLSALVLRQFLSAPQLLGATAIIGGVVVLALGERGAARTRREEDGALAPLDGVPTKAGHEE